MNGICDYEIKALGVICEISARNDEKKREHFTKYFVFFQKNQE